MSFSAHCARLIFVEFFCWAVAWVFLNPVHESSYTLCVCVFSCTLCPSVNANVDFWWLRITSKVVYCKSNEQDSILNILEQWETVYSIFSCVFFFFSLYTKYYDTNMTSHSCCRSVRSGDDLGGLVIRHPVGEQETGIVSHSLWSNHAIDFKIGTLLAALLLQGGCWDRLAWCQYTVTGWDS